MTARIVDVTDSLQQAIIESLAERNILARIEAKTVAKIYACLSEGAINPKEYTEMIETASPDHIFNVVAHRWEQLEATRQSLADAYEPLTAMLSEHHEMKFLADLVHEGRTSNATNVAIENALYAGHTNIPDWPGALLRSIERAAKVRAAEHHVGLIPDYTREGGR
jgi:hypothetical protein